jgi:hypothetical protein
MELRILKGRKTQCLRNPGDNASPEGAADLELASRPLIKELGYSPSSIADNLAYLNPRMFEGLRPVILGMNLMNERPHGDLLRPRYHRVGSPMCCRTRPMLGQFIMSGHIVHWLGEVKPHLCEGQYFGSFFRILRFIRPS